MTETIEPLLPDPDLPPVEKETPPERKRIGRAFAFDVFKLVSGTAATQVINFLATLLLARLYLPEDFGVSVLFSSFATVITVYACLRYELAVILPKTRDEAANVLAVSLGFALLTSLVMLPVFWFGRKLLDSVFNVPELIPYAWLIPVMVFVTAGYNALNFWNSRHRKYTRLSASRVVNEASTDALRLIWGYAGYATSSWLVTSNVLGSAITFIVLLYQAMRDDLREFLDSIRWHKMVAAVKRYKKFPLYTSWAAILNTLSLQLPSFMLSMFFSPQVTGYYAFGHRLVRLPVNLIGGAIGQVFFQKSSEAMHEGWLPKLVDEVFQRLVSFGLFPNLLVAVIGRELFIAFFGEPWAEAGVYSQILSFWVIFLFLVSPLSFLTSLMEKQEVSLIFNIVVFVSRALTLWIGGQLGGARFALWLFSLTGAVMYGWFCFWVTGLAGVPARRTARHFLISLAFSAPFLAVLAVAKWLLQASPLMLTGLGILAALGYYLIAISRDPAAWTSFRAILKKFGLPVDKFPSKG